MKESPEHIDQLIEQYLVGQLQGSEREEFENRLSNELLLKERLNHHLRISKLLEQDEGVTKFSDSIYEIFDEQEVKNNKNLYWQAAASIILAIGLIFTLSLFNKSKTNEELVLAYFEPFPDMVTSRTETDSLVSIAMTAYNIGQYSKAINYLKQVDRQERSLFDLYIAISHLSEKEYESALAILVRLEKTCPSNLHFTTKWYLSITMLALDQSEGAIERLKDLAAGSSSVQEQAENLLEELQ